MGNKTVDLTNLAAGHAFSWDSGDVTLTHSTNTLAFAGGTYSFDGAVGPSTNDAAALGSATVSWSDLFLASGAVLNFNNGDITLTHAADTLTLAGGQFITIAGTASLPGLGVGYADTGLYASSAAQIDVTLAGVRTYIFGGDALYNRIGIGYLGGSDDLIYGREAAAVWRQGAPAAAPIAQTFKGPDGSGTDKAGGDMTTAPGRSTGSGTPGKFKIAVSTPGTTGSSQQALVDRVVVDYGYVSFNPVDAAATPVASTAALKLFAYNKSVADDAVVTLPSVTTCGHGTAHVGGGDPGTAGFPFTHFFVDGSGNVVLLNPTTAADVSANADTDGDLCIGTADPQEPVQVKNRLAGVKVINIMFWYD